jgi:hypothetical protein
MPVSKIIWNHPVSIFLPTLGLPNACFNLINHSGSFSSGRVSSRSLRRAGNVLESARVHRLDVLPQCQCSQLVQFPLGWSSVVASLRSPTRPGPLAMRRPLCPCPIEHHVQGVAFAESLRLLAL